MTALWGEESNGDALRALEQREARWQRQQTGEWARAIASIEAQLAEERRGTVPIAESDGPAERSLLRALSMQDAARRAPERRARRTPEEPAPDEAWRGVLTWCVIGTGCVGVLYVAMVLLPIIGEWVRRLSR